MDRQTGKRCRRCAALCLTAVLLTAGPFTAQAADEKGMEATFCVEGSYTVTIPKAVTIYPSMDYRLDGEFVGQAEGGEAGITAVTNTEPGYKVLVRVSKDSFNSAGTGISLTNKEDKSKVLTTELSVRTGKNDEMQLLTKDNNIAAEFSGLTGASNAKVVGGSLHFSAPDGSQQSGEYEGTIVFEISYDKEN